MKEDPIYEQTAPTREMAERVAKWLGCEGAHRVGDGWSPCESAEALKITLKQGKAGYLAWHHRRAKKVFNRPKRFLLQPELAAELQRKRRRFYATGWEQLNERPIRGIDTLPGGGLVSGQ